MRIAGLLLLILGWQSVSAQVVMKQQLPAPNQYIVSFQQDGKLNQLGLKVKARRQQQMLDLRNNLEVFRQKLKVDMDGSDLTLGKSLWLRQAVAVTLSPRYLSKLNELDYVISTRPDRQYQVLPQAALGLSGEDVSDALADIDIDAVWSEGFRGQGVVVAILDTGVDVLHVDLKDQWRGGSNSWYDPFGTFNDPVDTIDGSGNAHGTAVASLVAGGNQNETGNYLGVAPRAQWIAARVVSDNQTSESEISDALQWLLDPDGDPQTDDYPDIVQNSWGLSDSEGSCSNPFAAELEALTLVGIDLVFSVGNTGPGASTYLSPSFDPNVISVGAVDDSNTVIDSSARGPDQCNSEIIPSLVAPGSEMIVADGTFGGLVSNLDNVASLSGTSFSAPLVAGALALLRSKFEVQNHLEYRQAIYNTATLLGASNDDPAYGRGLLQASAAATCLESSACLPATTASSKPSETNFSTASYSVVEPDPAKDGDELLDVDIIRSGDLSTAGSVRVISIDGTAKSGLDFESIDTTIDFAENEHKKSVRLSLLEGSSGEIDEQFTLQLLIAGSTLTLGSNTIKLITITEPTSDPGDPDDGNSGDDPEDEIGGASLGWIELLILISLLPLGYRLRLRR